MIEPYFYFWAIALAYFGWIGYQALGVLRRIESWLRALAEDTARSRKSERYDPEDLFGL